MSTGMQGGVELKGIRNTLPFGPYLFQLSNIYDQFLATEIQIAGMSTAQLVGGISPTIAAFTMINFLLLYPDQDIKVGLHGVMASSAGFTLNAYGLHVQNSCSMTSLQLYNSSIVTLNLFLVLGQM